MTFPTGFRKSKATRIFCLILCFLSSRTELFSQTISILGSNCVVAGTQYIYHIAGSYASATTKTWSAVGGTFTGASTGVSQVTVTWSTGSGRSISISTTGPTGSGNMTIGFSSTLVPGTISNPTQSINYNATPATINCPVPTGGDCGTPTYTYQWQQSTNNVTYTDISGATSQNLSFSAGLTQTMYYRRMVTVTSTGGTGYSSVATVTVYPAINPGSISPATQTINYNTNASLLTVSGVSGGTNSYSYQWQSSPTGSTWTNITGATATTYTPTNLLATSYFRAMVTSNGAQAAPNGALVTVYPQVIGGSVTPASPNINYNTSPGLLTLGSVSGGTGTYTYQWQSSTDGSNWTPVSGATGTTYTPGNLTVTTWYRVVVTSNGATGNSASSKITVYPVLVGGTLSPSAPNINYNTSPGVLTLGGVSGGGGAYTYQWQSSPDGSAWTNVSGATGTAYTPGNLTTTIWYRVVVTSVGIPANSSASKVTVYPQLVGGSISPGGGALGYSAPLGTLTLSGVTGGSGTYTYQWQSSSDGSNWTPVSGATSTTYAAGNLMATTWYRVAVTSNSATVSSSSVMFSMNTMDDLNFIRVRDILKPAVTDLATAGGLTSNQDVHQTTQYFDGLGRLMQTVSKKSTPAGQDAVAMTVYDAFGREATRYLPYASAFSDGFYKLTATAEQNSFNASQFSGESYFYGQVSYEASPLNRVLTTYAPGSSWVGASRGVSQQSLVNQVFDSVRIWTIAGTPGSLPTTTATYDPGTLYKSQTIDEEGHSIIEYKDKDGRVVLKKVQLAPSPGTAHMGWLCTYYVYDDLGNLRFVIQPQGLALLLAVGNWTVTTNIANEQSFRYEYDSRNRMMIKKIPGAGETWMVYDQWDRLVLTQDANLRTTNQWLFTKYDAEDRPVLTGLYTDATHNTQGSMQSYSSGQGLGRYENRNTSVQLGYTTTLSFPSISSMSYSTTDWMTISFYDDYTGGSLFGSAYYTRDNSKDGSFAAASNTMYPYPQAVTEVTATRGQPTITIARILGTSTAVYKVSFYDSRSRAVQVKTFTAAEATDAGSLQYSFDGKPLETVDYHQKNGTNAQTHTVVTKMTYDPGGRLLTVKKNIDAASSDQLIATNTYNELGQLQNKQLGNNLDNLAYAYNLRGWLTSINKNYLAGSGNNYFGMELGYDKSASAAPGAAYTGLQYNGNIAGTVWKTAGAGVSRKYDFTYDNVNRLITAAFTQDAGGGAYNINDHTNFSVGGLSYDANGNILSMNQNGLKAGASPLIDQLTYTYQPNSNKLAKVTDAQTDPDTKLGDFHDGTNGGTDDYSYDANGNLTLDNNKAISAITYNYLNMPQQITVTSKGTITYTYDAAGTKIKKVTVDNTSNPSKTTTTLYYGGFVYQQDTLQFIAHEEGRTRWAWHKYTNGYSAYGFEYDFFEKDHLGNTRVLLTQQKDTAKYLASGEAAYRNTESQLFANLTTTTTARATAEGYPADLTITNPNDTVFKVSGTAGGHKMGPSLLLKVMSGDKIDIAVQSYYNSGTNTNNTSALTDAIASLANGIVNMSSGGKGSLTDLNNPSSGPLYDALSSFLTNNDPNPSGKPKAYLNWILLDEQLKYVSSYPQSGAMVVAAAGSINSLAYTGIPITKSGYLYIWVSNETQNWNVFFDNLRVAHYTGPMLEETHYYPFGLTMAGISDKALKTQYAENKYRFDAGTELQNKEFADGSGLELYETDFRGYDPQIGRFWQIDPLADLNENESPYSFASNNPILMVDPSGLAGDTATLATVTVVGYKKDCQTCSPRTVEAGPPPDQGSAVASGPAPPKDPTPSFPTPTVSPLGPTTSQPSVTVRSSNTSYFDMAIKYPNVPYVSGRASPNGYDCSGLVCMVAGMKDHGWSTSSPGPPPGNWKKVDVSHDSYQKFIKDVLKGDLFLWRGHHVAFYAGNEQTFGAKETGKLSGLSKKVTGYTELKTYWIESKASGRGYPEVYRQN